MIAEHPICGTRPLVCLTLLCTQAEKHSLYKCVYCIQSNLRSSLFYQKNEWIVLYFFDISDSTGNVLVQTAAILNMIKRPKNVHALEVKAVPKAVKEKESALGVKKEIVIELENVIDPEDPNPNHARGKKGG